MGHGYAVTVLNSTLEYKPSLRNSILGVFSSIQQEVYSVIDFFGYKRSDYYVNIYPLTIEKVDGSPVSDALLECVRAKLSGKIGK